MAPSEFWNLTPTEFYWILDAKQPVKMFGKMTEHEVAAIYDEAYPAEDEWDAST